MAKIIRCVECVYWAPRAGGRKGLCQIDAPGTDKKGKAHWPTTFHDSGQCARGEKSTHEPIAFTAPVEGPARAFRSRGGDVPVRKQKLRRADAGPPG